MIEIRAPRTEELDDMLALMCEAFRLPFASARGPFYHDPYFDPDNKRVLVEDGVVVSCLTIVPRTMWIGDAAVRVAGIADVGTLQSHRGQGRATKLLTDTIGLLRSRGFGYCALFPYSYDFYRPLGWEQCSLQYSLRIPRRAIPSFADARYVRKAMPADRPEVADLYEATSRGKSGRFVRDEKRWTYLFDYIKHNLVYKRQRIEGYAIYEPAEPSSELKHLRMVEMVVSSDRAERGLLGHLANREQNHDQFEYTSGWQDLAASGLPALSACFNGDGVQVESVPGAMFRLIDFKQALDDLKSNFRGFNGMVSLVMADPFISETGPQAVTIEGDGKDVDLRVATEAENARRRISGDVRGWTPVLLGFHSLPDAVALGRLQPFSEATAAQSASLFPRRSPFVPSADHF